MMSFFDFFKSRNKSSAQAAKDRLQVIIAADKDNDPRILQDLKRDIIEVISRYFPNISGNEITVSQEKADDTDVVQITIDPIQKKI